MAPAVKMTLGRAFDSSRSYVMDDLGDLCSLQGFKSR